MVLQYVQVPCAGVLFPGGGPVDPRYMIGRVRWMESVAAGLANGANIAVSGARKEGKTTAGKGVAHLVASQGSMLPIVVDLYGVSEVGEFLEELSRAASEALTPGVGRVATGSRALLGRLLRLGAKETGLDQELGALEDALRGRGEIETALAVPSWASRVTGKSVLLLVDEAHRIANFPEGFRLTLHRAFRDAEGVSLLLVGRDEGLMRDLFESPLGPVSELVERWLELEPITDEEWHEGLPQRFAEGGCSIDPKAVTSIVAEGKQIGVSAPHSTMTICGRVLELARSHGTTHITHAHAFKGFQAAASDLHRIGGGL